MCERTSNDFNEAIERLPYYAFRQWLHTNYRRSKIDHVTDLAMELDVEQNTLGKYLSGTRRLTTEALTKLQTGFFRLSKRRGFAYEELTIPSSRELMLAGCLEVINREGERQKVGRFKPFGPLHFFCLQLMYSEKAWYNIIAGRGSTVADQLAQQIVTKARQRAEEIKVSPTEYLSAVGDNAIEPRATCLREMSSAWRGPWEQLYDCISHIEI